MPKYRPMPPLERLNELLEVVEIPPDKYGIWSGLVWKVRRNSNAKAGSVAGSPHPHSNNPDRVDWMVRVDYVEYMASRVIYYMTHGEDPRNIQVDHKDKNWLNNNAWNLRLDIDGNIQQINRPKQRNNTSGVAGVHLYKPSGKWVARVPIEGKRKNLGYYTCKIEAARAVRDKWIELEWNKLGRELPDLESISCDCGTCKRIYLG